MNRKSEKKRMYIRPWMGWLGLLGFLGFLSFPFRDPSSLIFFGFFGFFSFFWWGKMSGVQEDERLLLNQARAYKIAMTVSFCIIFIGAILTGNAVGSRNPAKGYGILVALIALGYALSMNLGAYLTYRFDQQE